MLRVAFWLLVAASVSGALLLLFGERAGLGLILCSAYGWMYYLLEPKPVSEWRLAVRWFHYFVRYVLMITGAFFWLFIAYAAAFGEITYTRGGP